MKIQKLILTTLAFWPPVAFADCVSEALYSSWISDIEFCPYDTEAGSEGYLTDESEGIVTMYLHDGTAYEFDYFYFYDFEEWASAESPGGYFNRYVRDQYTAHKYGRPAEQPSSQYYDGQAERQTYEVFSPHLGYGPDTNANHERQIQHTAKSMPKFERYIDGKRFCFFDYLGEIQFSVQCSD